MMMEEDSNNKPPEQGKDQQEEAINEAKAEAETLHKELLPSSEEHQLLEPSSGQKASQSQSQPPMPSDDMMRHSIADSLMEMLVNMTNSQYLHECLELLEASDPMQARNQILNILQRIDGEHFT
ncbi:uncharacterized protein LOC110187068 [Drosophila serrata]|uniref:uncharacterized protein LOC110187068 n=1 Tax=Drosophila serrata TaxID=7274 RepID=UPI000A1D25BC|nr:uncharacterized protein LOC110187068 [Drosophila serrata]